MEDERIEFAGVDDIVDEGFEIREKSIIRSLYFQEKIFEIVKSLTSIRSDFRFLATPASPGSSDSPRLFISNLSNFNPLGWTSEKVLNVFPDTNAVERT